VDQNLPVGFAGHLVNRQTAQQIADLRSEA
jgi:hypothetical protein